MKERALPYGRQSIDNEDIEAVLKALRGDFLTQGPAIEVFEKSLSDYLGARHVVAVSSGTAALHLGCLALGIGAGDAVFVPAITFAATSNAALYCGATPVFVDIDPATNGISLTSLEKGYQLATSRGLRPRALFPVHYAGLPADLKKLSEFAAEKNLVTMDDCCHALGAEYLDKKTGKLKRLGGNEWTNVSAWSFHPVKHITTCEGGALTTNDDQVARTLRMARTHGITREAATFEQKDRAFDPATGKPNAWYQEMHMLGYNYRLSDIHAALGTAQMKKVERFVTRRREIADGYRKALAGESRITLPPADRKDAKHSYHLFPVRLNYSEIGLTRHQVMEALREQNIFTQVHYVPVYWHPYYVRNPDQWLKVECPSAEAHYAEVLSLPLYPDMEDSDLDRVATALESLIRG